MKAEQYHQLRDAIDRVLAIFSASAGSLSADDFKLKHDIEVLRSRVVKSESTAPFAGTVPTTITPGAAGDPDITQAPWFGNRPKG